LRVFSLSGQSLWRDEVDAVYFATWPLNLLITGLFAVGHNGPLYYLLMYPWQSLAGTTEFAIRYPSVVAGVVVVPLGFALARQLGFSRRAGLLLSLLLSTSPYLVWYSQEAKMYTMLLALVMAAMMAYFKAITGHGRRWWLIFVGCTSLSFYLHILSPLMLTVYVAAALIFWPAVRSQWAAWLASMAALTLPYLPLVAWQFSMFRDGLSQGHPFYPLKQQFYLLLELYSGGLVKTVGPTAITLAIFLLLAGFLLANRHPQAEPCSTRRRLLLAVWLLLPPLAVYGISLRVPVFEDRYVIYIIPAFYLVVALGLILVRQYSRPLAALCLGLLLATNALGLWQQQRQPLKADFRAAATYLAAQPTPPATIIIQMPYLQRTFDYYYHRPYRFLEGLWTNGNQTEAEINAEMERRAAADSDVWLVVSEEDTWDSRHLMRAWLNQNAALVDQAHFMRVDVYHYQLQPGAINATANQP